jgi:N6-adenosine-specific RNA methylase IME4
MLRRVALVRTDVSEDLGVSIIRVTRIGELGTLTVTSNRRTLLTRATRRNILENSDLRMWGFRRAHHATQLYPQKLALKFTKVRMNILNRLKSEHCFVSVPGRYKNAQKLTTMPRTSGTNPCVLYSLHEQKYIHSNDTTSPTS